MILLKANDKLKAVFHKIIKTMGENVDWVEIFIINNNDLILLGSLRSLFFNFDTKRAYSNIIDVTINKDAIEEMTEHEMLENALNMTLYTFGKWGGIKGLKVEKDYDQLNKLLEYILKEIKVEASLTRDNLRFFHKGLQITYEEVIQMILDGAKPVQEKEKQEEKEEQLKEDEAYSLGLWHKMIWKKQELAFVKEEITDADRTKSRLGNQFYMINYKCPSCAQKLYMVVYPRDNEFRIETEEGGVYLARSYTCSACNAYYTPRPKRLLSDGEVYHLAFEEDKVAYEDYLELLGKQGQRIANSNFNQYERDYLGKEKEEDKPLFETIDDFEAMTQEELNELIEKMESGFYPEEFVLEYQEKAKKEWQNRNQKDKQAKRGKQENSEIQGSVSVKQAPKEEKTKITYEKNTKENSNQNGYQKPLQQQKEEKGSSYEAQSEKEEKNTSGLEFAPLSFEWLRKVTDLLKRDDEESFQEEIETLSKNQIEQLKEKIQTSKELSDEIKTKSFNIMQRHHQKKSQKQGKETYEACKNKSYASIQKVMEEVRQNELPVEEKNEALQQLKQYLEQAGKRELESIFRQVPKELTREQYKRFKEKIEEYKEADTRLSKKLLEEKWDEVEKQEINGLLKKINKKSRSSYMETYQRLKEEGYEQRNVEPALEKLHQRVYDMDMESIQDICDEPADLSFEEGLEAYEQILLGEYLPELKEDMLGQIEKRLTKLKTDECEQLVNKLLKELDSKVGEVPRLYFYNPRKMLRPNAQDAQTILIHNAIKSYGTGKEKFEYPILIYDTSYAKNGESGFILTPNHIFYRSLLESGKIDIMAVGEVFAHTGVLKKGIYVRTRKGKIKLAGAIKEKDSKAIAKVLGDFVDYLKDKPESRNVSYMAKEVHKVKCCYRCGYVYQDGNICPKCGSKMNG